jgi:hypothetical protein
MNLATLFNLAMHDGKALEREVRRHERALRMGHSGSLISSDPVIQQALHDALAGLRGAGRIQ